jgi:hypothetical protein
MFVRSISAKSCGDAVVADPANPIDALQFYGANDHIKTVIQRTVTTVKAAKNDMNWFE